MSEAATSTSDGAKTEQVKIYSDTRHKAMLEAISAGLDCSQSAAGRDAIEQRFADLLPEFDIEHFIEGRVSEEDLHALAQGDLSVDDLELDNEDAHDPTDRDPAHYSATITPEQLASEGAKCCYDTLREAAGDLVDSGYWGETFEVHPSRVGETTLRQNHKITSRVLAGMARSKMTSGVVSGDMLDKLVEDYALHLTSRMDQTRGEQHIRETYGDLVRSHFWRHPHPEKDLYFTSKARYLTAASGIIDELHGPLQDDVPAVFAHTTWNHANGTEIPEQEWHADLGALLKSAVAARRMAVDLQEGDFETLDIEMIDDAKDGCHHLTLLAKRAINAYQNQVGSYHRRRVEDHHVSYDVAKLL
ncbi:hypothetical protein [Haladaptatus sp. DYF46]|uniref:hypothetical protein n=1 Tax=Haladaptatus sp. DYF46 TaxID=2886041 RepID=UPI001E334F6B|nr:hypothetical protein [Haladaptatus sp. DYF46]